MEKKYTAGELARWAGVSARTIRFYEEKGILQPRERSAEGYRLYADSAIVRLQEILMLKHVGLSLEEIQQALQQGEDLSVSELLARQRELVLEERNQGDGWITVSARNLSETPQGTGGGNGIFLPVRGCGGMGMSGCRVRLDSGRTSLELYPRTGETAGKASPRADEGWHEAI